VRGIGAIPAGLAGTGFKPDEVEKIASGNWLRLYAEVFG
jgi:membrane dipeptidase